MNPPAAMRALLRRWGNRRRCGYDGAGCHPDVERDKDAWRRADDTATLVRRYIDDLINGNNLALAEDLFAPSYMDHTPGAPPVSPGPAGVRQTVAFFRGAFPDIHYAIEDVFGAGDRAAVRWTTRGTNTGPMAGAPPTGKAVTVSAVYIFRAENGKLTDAWGDFDALGMQQQLGLLPAPGHS